MSSDMARRNLRRFSAWRVLSDCRSRRLSLVTPSTRRAVSAPKSASISSMVASVSSTVSWSSAVTMDVLSSLRSARIPATSIGWAK